MFWSKVILLNNLFSLQSAFIKIRSKQKDMYSLFSSGLKYPWLFQPFYEALLNANIVKSLFVISLSTILLTHFSSDSQIVSFVNCLFESINYKKSFPTICLRLCELSFFIFVRDNFFRNVFFRIVVCRIVSRRSVGANERSLSSDDKSLSNSIARRRRLRRRRRRNKNDN